MSELVVAPKAAPASAGALAGIRVVEFGFAAAGPLVGKYLANHGADVIHVESRRAPDPFRVTYPPFKENQPGPDRAAMFGFYNDGKRAVTLNLRDPRALDLARELVRRADVVIESFTPGHMAKWGLDYAALAKLRPDLVMLSSCNQGQTGPHAQHPGYGSQLTALAGFIRLLGEPERTPVILYGPYIDYIAVGYGVIAILAALARRALTGRGCRIDLSQYEAGLQFMGPVILEHSANGRVANRDGNRDAVAAPHGVYQCAGEDRWCALSVWSDEEWERLRLAMGDPVWARDARFATASGRRSAQAEIDAGIGRWTGPLERDAIVERLRSSGLHAAPVLTISEVFEDPQLLHRGFWARVSHPVLDQIRCLAAPFRLSETPSRQERAGPPYGADNDGVFGGLLGLSPAERERLAREGVFD